MKDFLIVFSLGPVQSFIASSRKTVDLWSGSYLLSELVEEAMTLTERIFGQEHLTWIQPNRIHHSEFKKNDTAHNPNRFLFTVREVEEATLAKGLNQISTDLKAFFNELALEAAKKMFGTENLGPILMAQINEQTKDFLEIFWSYEPYVETVDHFNTVRKRNEQALASVKNHRFGEPMVQEGLVCTVCKSQNALSRCHPSATQTYGQLQKDLNSLWAPLESQEREANVRIKPRERLCATCTLKRMLRQLPKYAHLGSFQAVSTYTRGKNIDEDVLVPDDEKTQRYYALVKFDGDDMGKWVSNEKGAQAGEPTIASLQNITKKLSHFSTIGIEEALDGLSDKQVKVIYSGGDDVLAFGSILPMIRFVSNLRMNFANEEKGLAPQATASCGIVIAPEKAPLQQVVNYARRGEAKSKNYTSSRLEQEKDAFTIHFVRNSGNQRFITLPFTLATEQSTFSGKSNLLAWLLSLADLMAEIEVSRNFIYHFKRIFDTLLPASGEKLPFQAADQIEIVESQLRKVIHHSAEHIGEQSEQLIHELTFIYEHYEEDFLSYIHLLEIIHYLGSLKNEEVSHV